MKQRLYSYIFFILINYISLIIGIYGLDITIMTYNVMQSGITLGKWGEEIRAAYLTDALLNELPKNSHPDVIIFTEASSTIFKYVLKTLEKEYPYQTSTVGSDCSETGWDSMAGSCLDTPLAQSGGVLIISKFKIQSQHGYIFETRLSKTSDGVINRGAVYVQLKIDKTIFHIVGTHLQSSKSNVTEEEHQARVKQLKEIDIWLKEFSIPKTEALVIAGDFNEELSNKEYIEELKDAIQADFKLRTDSNTVSYSCPTNSLAKASSLFLSFIDDYEEMLDYIMIGTNHLSPEKYSGMEVISIKSSSQVKWKFMQKRFYPKNEDHPYVEGSHYDLSDHFPVISSFKF